MPAETARLPPARPDQNYVKIYPFTGGTITLPERMFVAPADPEAHYTVPSLSFLIEHPNPPSRLSFLRPDRQSAVNPSKPFRMMFDLGLRSALERYLPKQQEHIRTRSPYQFSPGRAADLEAGGLSPETDIPIIMLSHVHWDHHGDPEDFPGSDFVVGNGAWNLIKEGLGGIAGHQIFQSDLLPEDRTTELPPAASSAAWKPLGPFQAAYDLLGDGSLYVVDSPGHLPGHVNLLARLEDRWLYFTGDAAHDVRLLTGEKSVGTWKNDAGHTMCIHFDQETAEKTIATIRRLKEIEGDNVEVVMAHDGAWAERNKSSFFPNHL